MAFPRRSQTAPLPEDPQALYRSLAETNTGPENLWIHQAELLADWHSHHQDTPDVAIELPTGAGKTLVGALIAEYRRRVHRERTAIACPTRQLARQTAERLTTYGVPNVLLIGRARDWDPASRARYTRADAAAVTVYHHVFNSNPAIDDAQVLIFDDAHAAEQAVAGPWSAVIDRDVPLYVDLLAALTDAVDPLVLALLRNDDLDPRQRWLVYLASPAGVATNGPELERVLNAAVASGTGPRGLGFTLVNLGGHVDRALIYLSHRAILIRPLIPPTSRHTAFARPRQRVYMSATLGHGGELERAFGRASIARIPIPKGWDTQGTGRRFFALPELTRDLRGQAVLDWTQDLIRRQGRALVLTPSERDAQVLKERLVPDGFEVLRADDVEDDLGSFTGLDHAVLVLANRYDGIDLPGDDCRVVVLAGLPSRGDLQESFLHDSLGAFEVLRERVRARIAQGSGRATRNTRDHSAVVILGEELMNFVSRQEVASAMHPELQAELAWGMAESEANTGDELLGDLEDFFGQTNTWREANKDIIETRQGREVTTPPGTAALDAAAPREVQAWSAAWQGEWDHASAKAREVIDKLSGGREVQRYAALWHYLLAHWVLRANPDSTDTAGDYLKQARAAGRGTSWLDHLASPADAVATTDDGQVRDAADVAAIDRILSARAKLGKNSLFEPKVAVARAGLAAEERVAYEAGLVTLGELAGASSVGEGGATAAPDAAWRFGDALWISWEAKSEADPAGELGANDVRQAGSHLRYMEAQHDAQAPVGSYGLIVTPQGRVEPAGIKVAEGHLFRTRPSVVLGLFDRVVRAWGALRARGGDFDAAYAIFAQEGALPSQWRTTLQADRLVGRDT